MSFLQQCASVSGSSVSSGQLRSTPSSCTSPAPTMSSACCENGRSLINPHTGQTICSCQYSPGLLTYSRMGLPDPVYSGTAYSTTQGYMSLGADQSAFYPPLNSPYELKEAGETWRGLGQHPGCYPYDPSTMSPHPYPNSYGTMDINSAARRKNATRENTNTLKAWLYEHRKNPYPTKGEKIMLAIITKMTLTQVSTWFANARRRLKKENKMTWSPRNKPGTNDEDDDNDSKDKAESDDENERGKSPTDEKKSCDREGQLSSDVTEGSSPCSTMRTVHMYNTPPDSAHMSRARLPNLNEPSMRCPGEYASIHLPPETSPSFLSAPLPSRVYSDTVPAGCLTSPTGSVGSIADTSKRPDSLCSNSNDSVVSDVNCSYADANLEGLRPKIWSLAQVATSDPGYSTHCHSNLLINNNNNSSPRNINSISYNAGTNTLPAPGGSSLASGPINSNYTPGHNRHESFQSSSSSASSSASSFTPSPSVPHLPPSMSHWSSMYGPPPQVLGNHNGNPPCSGPPHPQTLPMMVSGVHMVPASLNSLPNLHGASPPSCYVKAQGQLPAYYSS